MKIMIILIAFLLCICIFNLYLSMLRSIKSKTYVYSVQIMNGKSSKKILIENIAEIVFIVVISLFIVFALKVHWLHQNMQFYVKFFFIILSTISIIIYWLNRYFEKLDIEQLMRGI